MSAVGLLAVTDLDVRRGTNHVVRGVSFGVERGEAGDELQRAAGLPEHRPETADARRAHRVQSRHGTPVDDKRAIIAEWRGQRGGEPRADPR